MPALLLQILGQVLAAVIPPVLQWLFSGEVLNVVKVVPGVANLDTTAAPDAPLDLPVYGEPQ